MFYFTGFNLGETGIVIIDNRADYICFRWRNWRQKIKLDLCVLLIDAFQNPEVSSFRMTGK